MPKTPIEMMLGGVQWIAVDPPDDISDLPYATHEGVLNLLGMDLKCYRLSTGQAIFDAEDMEKFFEMMESGSL